MKNFAIEYNAVENLVNYYVDHVMEVHKMNGNNEFNVLKHNPDYNFHLGCMATAENWMNTIGVSPTSDYVQNLICERACEES